MSKARTEEQEMEDARFAIEQIFWQRPGGELLDLYERMTQIMARRGFLNQRKKRADVGKKRAPTQKKVEQMLIDGKPGVHL